LLLWSELPRASLNVFAFTIPNRPTRNRTWMWLVLSYVWLLYCEISGSHAGEYEDGCLLGCCAM
jgi:hypothetical protein